MRLFFATLLLTLTLQTVKGQTQLPIGVQAILNAFPQAKYLGTSKSRVNKDYWAFYDSQDPNDEGRVYVTVPAGSTPQEFKEADRTDRTATLNWIVEQRTPNWESLVSKRDEEETPPPAAQLKIAVDANLHLRDTATVSAVGVYISKADNEATWIFYCKSLDPKLPNILLWTQPGITLEEFHESYGTAIAAVGELKARYPKSK